MSLFSWLRGSNGMTDSTPMGQFRRRTAPNRPAPRFRPRLEALEDRTVPSTFHVADVAGLQAAVAAVNTNPSERATIVLDDGAYDLTSELQVVNASHLRIKADHSGAVVLDNPAHSDRIFEFDGGNVTLDGLVISEGNSHAGSGGGIFAINATLTVDHCTISGNSATDGGGILSEDSTLKIDHSTIAENSAGGFGGGVFAEGGALSIMDSTIRRRWWTASTTKIRITFDRETPRP